MRRRAKRLRNGHRPALGKCWCGRNGSRLIDGESPDGRVAFHAWPACVDHLFPESWPASVWDEIAAAMLWELSPAWDDACPSCALPHGPLTTCAAFRATVDASWPYRAPAVH